MGIGTEWGARGESEKVENSVNNIRMKHSFSGGGGGLVLEYMNSYGSCNEGMSCNNVISIINVRNTNMMVPPR